jgi:hypothetical protein
MNNQTSPQMNNQTSPQMNNQTSPQMNNQTSPQMNNQTSPQMNNQINPQMNNQTSPQMNNQTSAQMNNSVTDQMNNQTNPQMNNSITGQMNNQTNDQMAKKKNTLIKPQINYAKKPTKTFNGQIHDNLKTQSICFTEKVKPIVNYKTKPKKEVTNKIFIKNINLNALSAISNIIDDPSKLAEIINSNDINFNEIITSTSDLGLTSLAIDMIDEAFAKKKENIIIPDNTDIENHVVNLYESNKSKFNFASDIASTLKNKNEERKKMKINKTGFIYDEMEQLLSNVDVNSTKNLFLRS